MKDMKWFEDMEKRIPTDEVRKLRDGAAAQLCGVLAHGKAVQVGHEVVAVKLIGKLRPVLDRAEVVAKVQVA